MIEIRSVLWGRAKSQVASSDKLFRRSCSLTVTSLERDSAAKWGGGGMMRVVLIVSILIGLRVMRRFALLGETVVIFISAQRTTKCWMNDINNQRRFCVLAVRIII